MEVDNPADMISELAPDDEETWTYIMRKVLPDLRSERTMTEHPDDAAAKAPLIFPPELRVLPDADCNSAHLRKVLRTRLEQRSALQDQHDVLQERCFDRCKVHALTCFRAQEDDLREPCDGDEDEFRVMKRKFKAIHAHGVYAGVQDRFCLWKDQEVRLEQARRVLGSS